MTTAPNNFLGLTKQYSSYKNSKVVVVPVPYEATVSYGKGTRSGPRAIVAASKMVEYYDEELDRESFLEFGIHTMTSVNLGRRKGPAALGMIEKTVDRILQDGKFPFCLGGEHSITSPIVKAFHRHFGDSFSVLQIDAHSDLRETYSGTPWSHACVMKRIWEFHPDIVQVGIRAQCIEERQFIRDHAINTFYAKDMRHPKEWIIDVVRCLKSKVYITFDCDGLDPTIIPATGTPEPGGLSWDATLDLLRIVGRSREIIGCDIVELAPARNSPVSDYNLAKLAYRMMGYAMCLK